MISQVPRQLEFGNPAHIARVDEWQGLNDAEREMLLEVEQIDDIELVIRLQGAVYEVLCYAREGHPPLLMTTTDIDDVPNVIGGFCGYRREVSQYHRDGYPNGGRSRRTQTEAGAGVPQMR